LERTTSWPLICQKSAGWVWRLTDMERLRPRDVETAFTKGVNFLYWRGQSDYMSDAIAGFGKERQNLVIAVRFKARTAKQAAQEFASALTGCGPTISILQFSTTFNRTKSGSVSSLLTAPWSHLSNQKRFGAVKMIGLSSHRRPLAARWSQSGRLDLLMVRYNAAHRGAEVDLFPMTEAARLPVISFTALRWGHLLLTAPKDPQVSNCPQPFCATASVLNTKPCLSF
jgi:aryl-alcohol dehydrogenase-like predicted oxidoreductase